MKKPASLRQLKKQATRNALLATANQRFREKGFEATTIDELCAAVPVSRRTFFRYFASKEALVFPHREERLKRFLGFLLAAPANEGPFDVLRRATNVLAAEYNANRDHAIAQQQLIDTSPALQAMEREIDRDWEVAIAKVFVERSGPGPGAELRARVLAGATLGVIRATMRHWYAGEGREDLEKLGMEALDCLERGFPLE